MATLPDGKNKRFAYNKYMKDAVGPGMQRSKTDLATGTNSTNHGNSDLLAKIAS